MGFFLRDKSGVTEVRHGRWNGHHLSISVCRSVSCNQRQILCAAPSSLLSASICIWHRTQWTPRWPRWSTETPPWTGRRRMTAETAEEVNGGKRESERKEERTAAAAGSLDVSRAGREEGAFHAGKQAEIALESLLGQESLGRIVYKVVPPLRQRERATIVRTNVKGGRRRRVAGLAASTNARVVFGTQALCDQRKNGRALHKT